MTTSIRHMDITNTTAALLPSGSTAILCNTGQDYSFVCINRTFITAEIGTGTGQTQDTTSNPTVGFLFAQFQGSNVKNVVISSPPLKSVAGTHTTLFERSAWATVDPHISNIGFRFVNPSDPSTTPGWSPNYSSIYMLDAGDNAATRIANGDKIRILVELGNA